ncbi:MAG: hypothetical protein JW958_01740 [Candidatus Eisenbacteria bacterium]|nr:hypothetical protein [Candidatus Eisenbacteria bacterium]
MRTRLARTPAIAVLLFCLAASAAEGASSRIRPAGDPPQARVRIGGKWSLYHMATRNNPLEFKIHGGSPFRVISRCLFEGGEDPEGTVLYGIRLEIDGVELHILDEEGSVDSGARLEGGGPVGTAEKRIVRIPPGTHTLRVAPVDPVRRVAIRLLQGDGVVRKMAWVSYAPETYEQAIRLHTGDTETVYYRFSKEVPVTLFLNGPVRLKVRTRLDFGVERGYSQRYAIKVSIDGELLKSFPLKGRASHTSVYPGLPEITPGTGRDVEFVVPGGRHSVTIALDCTTGDAASLRILIPRRAVTNGE